MKPLCAAARMRQEWIAKDRKVSALKDGAFPQNTVYGLELGAVGHVMFDSSAELLVDAQLIYF